MPPSATERMIMGVMGDKKVNARSNAKTKKEVAWRNDGWRGFVNVELTADQKAHCKSLSDSYGEAWTEIIALVESGYKLSATFDPERTTWNLSLTCRDDSDDNNGLTLSGRGGSFQGACLAFWYRHVWILKGNWSTEPVAQPRQMKIDDVG